MTSYLAPETAILLIDPYNDFLSEGGKLFELTKRVAVSVRMINHMRDVVAAARGAGIVIFYVPHRRATPEGLDGWKHVSPYQQGGHQIQLFAAGTWGGEWHPDFVPHAGDVMIKEHLVSSGFANTDLDFQLKQRGIGKIILIGMLANTCLESTGKFGVELGYHVTLVKDATSAFSDEAMRVAHEINGPTYAHAILSTDELIAQLPGTA